jgi:Mg-chelatase subunit ChlD|tara:strand:+ start:4098 stop:5567 length:1470 start_codon:yes stop_codon:yes gene_type:complete
MLFLLPFSVQAYETPSELIIHQTSIEEKRLFSFISVYDIYGDLIEDPSQGTFEVNYGDQLGDVIDIRNFSSEQFGTGYVFMVDISKSVTIRNFEIIKQSIITWIDSLNAGDAVSIITFGEEVKILSKFSYNREMLKEVVKGIERTDMETRLNDGLVAAHNLTSIPDINFPSRRAIICLTDGINEYSAGGATKQEVIEVLNGQRLSVYTIGFAENLNKREQEGINTMSEFSEASGGLFFDANSLSIEGAYKKAKNLIDSTYMLISRCDGCVYEGELINLNIKFDLEGTTLRADAPLQLISSDNAYSPFKIILQDKTFFEKYFLILLSVFFLTSLAIGYLLFVYFKNSNPRAELAVNINLDSNHLNDEFEPAGDLAEGFRTMENVNSSINFELTAVSNQVKEKYKGLVVKNFTIGRSAKSNLVISDQAEISGQHCNLDFINGQLFVSDNNSTNKTFVNGVSIKDRFLLSSGDTLGLGRAEYRITFDEEEEK